MIKKIVLDFSSYTSSSSTIYKMQFYTKVDGEWVIYDVGNSISANASTAYFDNLSVESTVRASITYQLRSAFDGTGGTSGNFIAGTGTRTVTITFPNGIRVLSGIYYSWNANFCRNVKIRIYDENDRVIYSDDSPTLTSSSSASTVHFYKTTGLEVMKVYPINTIGTIETNDNTQITSIYQIEGITTEQNTPENTNIRYLLSFDGRNTYKTYKDNSWVDVDISTKSNIMTQGLTKEEIESLTVTEFNEAMTENKTLDIIGGMTTQDEYSSPSISQVKVLYLKIV